jgi:hypothetical protein
VGSWRVNVRAGLKASRGWRGDLHGLHAMRSHLKGYNERLEAMRFHNVWLGR